MFFTTDLFYVLWGEKIIIKSYTAVNILAMPEFIAEQIKVDRFDISVQTDLTDISSNK